MVYISFQKIHVLLFALSISTLFFLSGFMNDTDFTLNFVGKEEFTRC